MNKESENKGAIRIMEQRIRTIDGKLDLIIKLLTESQSNNQIQITTEKLTKEEIEDILQDFLINGDGILKEVVHGLAIDKKKLYKHFKKYGLNHTEVLRTLDEYDCIYHKEDSRTPLVKYDKKAIRAIVVKK